jgi:agmatine deiminase
MSIPVRPVVRMRMPVPSETPASLGYRLPAEWEPHEATWIAWPHNPEDWPGKFSPIPWVYTEIVRLLSAVEPVHIIVQGRREARGIQVKLRAAGVDPERIRFLKARTDRSWLRDTLPSFVVREATTGDDADESDGEHSPVAAIDWKFNAWAKYDNYRHDDRLPKAISRYLGITRWKPRAEVDGAPARIVLEGGSIDVNGRGTLLTTEECLLDPQTQSRNPGLSREDMEGVFADCLGVRRTIWLGRGIVGDDTHGHVDDIARFVDPTTVVAAVEPDPSDPNHEPLQDNLERLRSATDQDGNPLRVVELPMPSPVYFDDQRLPASYANFYIANGVVLVPTFNDPSDRIALDILASVFPERRVVGVHSVDLVLGLGTLHCLTHEQPASPVSGGESP